MFEIEPCSTFSYLSLERALGLPCGHSQDSPLTTDYSRSFIRASDGFKRLFFLEPGFPPPAPIPLANPFVFFLSYPPFSPLFIRTFVCLLPDPPPHFVAVSSLRSLSPPLLFYLIHAIETESGTPTFSFRTPVFRQPNGRRSVPFYP